MRDHVFEPRDDDADRGAHGMFDDQAKSRDAWSWASMHRAALAGVAVAAVAAVIPRAMRRG